jgi:hypothetical protein
MKITKQRLKEIIREEYQRSTPPGDGFGDNDDGYPPERPFPSLGDLQSDEKYTGGTPIEKLNILIKARKELAAMSKEDLTALSKRLDAEQVAVLRHILANPMYKESGEMELEEAAPWDKEALKRSYPGDPDAHAVIDREHNYGTSRRDVISKIPRSAGDPRKSDGGRSR